MCIGGPFTKIQFNSINLNSSAQIKDYLFQHGWGRVVNLRDSLACLLTKTCCVWGKVQGEDRSLYWDSIDMTPPPKPKEKVKKWRWVMRYLGVDDLYVTGKYYSEEEVERLFTYTAIQKVDSTEIEE